jgi:hypothetical protein
MIPEWAEFSVKVEGAASGTLDFEYCIDWSHACDQVNGGMVVLSKGARVAMLRYPPPKVGEFNTITEEGITVTITRVKEF